MDASKVADIVVGGTDSTGATILTVYFKFVGDHAIYRTQERVAVHFADDDAQADAQQAKLAPLNPLRGQINGLIDGWRTSRDPGDQTRAILFDRRVADALSAGLQGDAAQAEALLSAIKEDIVAERTARARVTYLAGALAATGLLVFVSCLFTWSFYRDNIYPYSPDGIRLWLSVGAGALGALFSVALRIRSRQILTDLQTRENAVDAALRVAIGAIAGLVLVDLFLSQLVKVAVGTVVVDGGGQASWLVLAFVAFLAGFSERIVPNLLEQGAATPARTGGGTNPLAGADPLRGPVPAPAPVPAGGGAGGPPGGGGGDSPPDPEDGVDCCPADPDVQFAEETQDVELPPASGGVEEPAPAG